MAYERQDNEAVAAAELIVERGREGLADAVSMLINETMRLERERHLGWPLMSAVYGARAMRTATGPRP